MAYNLVWYFGRYRIFYEKYKTLVELGSDGKLLVDNDDYNIYVNLPRYLIWEEGNLAVSMPYIDYGNGEWSPGDAIIIWLNSFSGSTSEVGYISESQTNSEQIYLIDRRTARYKEQQATVDNKQTNIDLLYNKAISIWGEKIVN